jgi:hypothetical protein
VTYPELQAQAIENLRDELAQYIVDNHLSFEEMSPLCGLSAQCIANFVHGRTKGIGSTRQRLKDMLKKQKEKDA